MYLPISCRYKSYMYLLSICSITHDILPLLCRNIWVGVKRNQAVCILQLRNPPVEYCSALSTAHLWQGLRWKEQVSGFHSAPLQRKSQHLVVIHDSAKALYLKKLPMFPRLKVHMKACRMSPGYGRFASAPGSQCSSVKHYRNTLTWVGKGKNVGVLAVFAVNFGPGELLENSAEGIPLPVSLERKTHPKSYPSPGPFAVL